MKIIDLHCDTLYRLQETGCRFADVAGHVHEGALKAGQHLAQCFAAYQPTDITGEEGYRYFMEQTRLFREAIGGCLRPARGADAIRQNADKGAVSAMLTVENADFLQGDPERLSAADEAGVVFLGLIHNGENCLGYPQTRDPLGMARPLKPFGREVVDRLNSTGMTADVSHLNDGGFRDVASLSKKSFVATHSGCRAIWDHPRNLRDEQIRAIAQSGGVVGTVFYSRFLNGTNTTAIEDILRHLHHLIKVGGEEVAALGSDFDGMECRLPIKDAGEMPVIAEAIIKAFGFSVAEKICYKNALRLL